MSAVYNLLIVTPTTLIRKRSFVRLKTKAWLSLRSRLVLLLLGLSISNSSEILERALHWLSALPSRALPRARWWFSESLGSELDGIKDTVFSELAVFQFLLRRIGFGRPGQELGHRILWVKPSMWSSETVTTLANVAPGEFVERWVWMQMFSPGTRPETTHTLLEVPGFDRADHRQWTVILHPVVFSVFFLFHSFVPFFSH